MKVSRRAHVPPFAVMEIIAAANERRAQGESVLNLCAGEPGAGAAEVVRQRAAALLQAGDLGYTEALGVPALRAAIAEHYRAQYGVDVPAGRIAVTTGSSGGFLLAFLAAFDAGDRVALARPGYPAYANILSALGCEVVELPCGPDERYQPTVALLAAAHAREPLAGLVVASPANPTGTMVAADELAALADWCERHGVRLISDEIYHGISYGRRCASARRFGSGAVVLGSLSKYHSMTGWRVGWLLLPPALRRPVELLQGNLAICAPALSQVAGIAAFDAASTAELDGHVARYAVNRELLLRRLPELGITSFAPPDGAFYAYCDVSHLTDDSQRWCEQVLAATGVALAPGRDFDPVDGHRMMRLSFCGRTAELEEALDRLVAYLRS